MTVERGAWLRHVLRVSAPFGVRVQDFNLLSALTVIENVELACHLADVTGSRASERARPARLPPQEPTADLDSDRSRRHPAAAPAGHRGPVQLVIVSQ